MNCKQLTFPYASKASGVTNSLTAICFLVGRMYCPSVTTSTPFFLQGRWWPRLRRQSRWWSHLVVQSQAIMHPPKRQTNTPHRSARSVATTSSWLSPQPSMIELLVTRAPSQERLRHLSELVNLTQ